MTTTLEQIKERIEGLKTTERDIEPLGAMCLEFADGWDNALLKVQAILPSIIQEVVEGVKKDYIKWVFSNSYDRKYDGDTPFGKWKDEAEVEDMRNWK